MFAAALRQHRAGNLGEARRLYRQVLEVDHRHSDALYQLGALAQQDGRNDIAVDLIGKAIRLKSSIAAYHVTLGVALRGLGRLNEAAASFATALRLKPDHAQAHFNLGNALRGMGQLHEAAASFDAARRANPGYAEAHSNLGSALSEMGRLPEAIACFGIVLGIKPDYPQAHTNLGHALRESGRLDDAVIAFRTALCLKPDLAEAYCLLGNACADLGRFAAALGCYGAALRIRPDYADAHSNFLMCLHYQDAVTGDVILAQAMRFAERIEARHPTPSVRCSGDPDRRLRIGYVSGDFRRHPVGYFLTGVLANHDTAAVEIFCYSNGLLPDDLTSRLRDRADHWRSLVGLSDQAAAALIAADGIDILIDLSGHTRHNRLPLFALKPAPIQVTWLGYWGTTGLSRMDYILSDKVMIPVGEDRFYREQVVRLPLGRFCYDPPDYAPLPAPLRDDRPITFGSFNNLAKIGPAVVRHWSDILHAVPDSRMMLKWKSLTATAMRRRVTDAFAAHGIESERLVLRGASPHQAMLADYAEIDIALDPFPFSGGLTSCEALWMGVPVVTLPGTAAASRQTLGILTLLGLSGWSAASPSDHIRIVTELAADRPLLARLRLALRDQVARSPLCDGPGFTAALERAYREMWRRWCKGARAESFSV